MEYAYMGIFSSIFNWVLDKILSPVFNFLAKLLSSVLSWIFNKILAPLLEEVLWPLIKATLDLIVQMLAGVLYGLYAKILSLVDTMNSAFDCLIGLSDIKYNGKPMPLLEAMFSIDGVRKAFLIISCMGLAIALMLTIYATIKSTLDLDFENKRPVSRVLSALFKSFIQLFTVQLVVLFVIKLSGLILKGIDTAMLQISGGSVATTLGRMVFVVSSMNACKSDTSLNLNGSRAGEVGISDSVRSQFYNLTGKKYTNIGDVTAYFDVAKFDYVIGICLAVFLLVVMVICLVIFVQRLFDMLMLYLVSPLFVAMIPLDDGERFGKWRELFLGKCFGGFGMVMAMKLYIMLCPTIMSSSLVFSSSKELDYLTKMIFILGGAWAVLKSGNTVTSLLSAEAGRSEQETGQVAGGAMYGLARSGMSAVGSGITMAAGALGSAAGKSKQKFENTRYQKEGGTSGLGMGGGGTDTQGTSNETSRFTAGPGNHKPEPVKSFMGVKTYKGSGGKTVHGFAPGKGKAFKIGSDGKGNKNVKIMGVGVRFGADGKVNKVSVPCLRWKKDQDGNMRFNRVSVLGCTSKRNSATGDMYFKDFNLLGMHRKQTEDGQVHLKQLGVIGLNREQNDSGEFQTTSLLGGLISKEKQEDGRYHISSLGYGAVQSTHMKEEDGSTSLAGVRVLGFNFGLRKDAEERNQKK